MKNVIFDFDSTLIKKESLELILEPLLKQSPSKLKEIEYITNLGMQGDICFRESLERRLAIASPTKQSIKDFADKYCPDLLTSGIKKIIETLRNKGYQIWIFSGGLTESIEPFADYLHIPRDNIFAVDIVWNDDGSFKTLDNSNGACDSKLSAFDKVKDLINGDIIAVGDGYTDYQLYESGYVNKFIAYFEHVEREKVSQLSKYIARNVDDLELLLF
ncbi:HAD-IB family phosphatase [Francisella philomiragia]|uniref:HAD-IB family phosphatase n=1 Tax=Francisella philomiragia TaxID=28110 RepID=UPI001908D3EF|nr:HAD-IB family phosphatase [Francisella philomiragia]MBK2093867.1 HAD-IB family phosphatase [Francisella philomiragia]MBK2256337.1 HAD-IB family phosphatase [Francisella philomiragia]MBK2268995.1 HAD-IB family phosphatase [Francisella philomiragia]MBK2270531.1 HAD-IB family phosphatase [Francisella philomiragia]MBK2274310.1 HAD-IB family phosphatase [Francisella philomiragia]